MKSKHKKSINKKEATTGQAFQEKSSEQEPKDSKVVEEEKVIPAENSGDTSVNETDIVTKENKPIIRHRLPKNYWEYLLLIFFSLVLFIFFALKVDDPTFSMELKQMSLDQYLHLNGSTCRADSSLNISSIVIGDRLAGSGGIDTTGVSVSSVNDTSSNNEKPRLLLIGDSMNEFLRIRLNDYCIENGYNMDCVIWYGATTKQYGTCDTISYFINKYHPTYVLLTIGSNELFIRDIIKKRTGYAKHIVSQIGNIPFVWIGPPNWKEDTGINQLILQQVGQSHYFSSKDLSFNRCKDGAHPTKSSAFKWLDQIAKYLETEAENHIVMNSPDTNYNKIPHTTILKMVR